MKPIYEETIKAVFVRMFNKLYTNKDVVLKPFIQNVKRIIDARLEDEGIKNFDKEIEHLLEQERMLLKLKEKGYADEEIFNAIVEKITVKSDKHIIFELKNGLSLDEYFEKQRGRKGKIIFKEGENG